MRNFRPRRISPGLRTYLPLAGIEPATSPSGGGIVSIQLQGHYFLNFRAVLYSQYQSGLIIISKLPPKSIASPPKPCLKRVTLARSESLIAPKLYHLQPFSLALLIVCQC